MSIISKFNKSVNQKGSKSVVCAREGGASTTSFLAAHFAKRNTKNCGDEKRSGESEGGQKIRGLGGRNFCPPSLSDSNYFPPPPNFVFRFAKCAA
ncbi:MAG: hypothetical protein V1649_02890 [Patescibacteria group bacterium]